MNVVKASIILGLSALVIVLIFPLIESILTVCIGVKYSNTGLEYGELYSLNTFVFFLLVVAGIFLTLISALGLIIFFIPFRKAFMGCGIFWIIISIISVTYIGLGVYYTSDYTFYFSYKDLSQATRFEREDGKDCCYYTDEVEREDENGDSFTDYKVFANCPIINQTNPNIDWSKCEGSGDDMLCYASDVGISLNFNICDSDSDFVPYVIFMVFMFLYAASTLMYAILHFIMFYLTKIQQSPDSYDVLVPGTQFN